MNTTLIARNKNFSLEIFKPVNFIYGRTVQYPIWMILNNYGDVIHCYSGPNAGTHARQMYRTTYSRSSRQTYVNPEYSHMSSLNG
jgi:hypothetical protein